MPRTKNPATARLEAGQRIGEWTLLSKIEPYRDEDGKYHSVRWLCRCSCGIERSVLSDSLAHRKSDFCGIYLNHRTKTPKITSIFDLGRGSSSILLDIPDKSL